MACSICASAPCEGQQFPVIPDGLRFDCPRCGSYILSYAAAMDFGKNFDLLQRSIFSHIIRRMQSPRKDVLIADHQLPTFILQQRLPTPQQQADNLILWIGDNQPSPDTAARTTTAFISAWVGAALSPDRDKAFAWLNTQLVPLRLYEHQGGGSSIGFQLTMNGWARYQELKKVSSQSRTAFMAMKFGDSILDDVVEHCFKPAVLRAGFELRKLTDQQPAGLIDDQIRAALISGRFVIADLTHGSHGAYWEAGYAEGLGLPVIYTCQKRAWEETKTHFDTNHMVTIIWDETEVSRAESALLATIRATFRSEAKQSD
jgi:hypothetical protein